MLHRARREFKRRYAACHARRAADAYNSVLESVFGR